MSRRERRKTERRRRSAQQRANRLRRAESPSDSPEDRQDDPRGAVAGSRCPECDEPVRWSTVAALLEFDPEVVGQIEEALGSDLLARADLWTCPACGAAGVVTDEDPYDPDDPDPDGFEPHDLDEIDGPEGLDEHGALDDLFCRVCRSPLEWLDPARVASIDRAAYRRAKEQYGADALLDGDAAACWTCGSITFVPDQGLRDPGLR